MPPKKRERYGKSSNTKKINFLKKEKEKQQKKKLRKIGCEK